ncbi:hypothetical protein LTR78_002452 [Recurvomyces mirabilis]|uniref:Methyltransferase type 11 domain-containing protein n=1 Tax=Recurvomyces mirabilis TaxID=574656 RepID=A0AAE0WT37_9PEZI|nr:hypothetical protein LTR78_002452 [Recurvomyces mirabilis]
MASSQVLNTAPADRRVVLTNEKVTGPVAAEMLRLSTLVDTSVHRQSLEILDNATGGGILVSELLKLVSQHSIQPKRIIAGDLDDKMLQAAAQQKTDCIAAGETGWQNVEIAKVDHQSLPYLRESFTHLFSNMGIFFCADDHKALTEAYRVLKHSGQAGFSSWKSIAWWPEVAQPALKAYLPDTPELPSPSGMFPVRVWSDPEAIPGKLDAAGFVDVKVSEYTFTPVAEAEEFAEATGVLVNIVAKRFWAEEVYKKYAGEVEPALLRYLKEHYEDGRWTGRKAS